MYITPRQIEPQQVPMPPQPRPSAPAGGGMKINVLRSIKLHAITASLVAIVTCGLGLALVLRHKPFYSATSTIYVSPNFPKTLTDDREQQYQYETYIQEEMHTITRYDVIADAIRKLPPGTWGPSYESEQSAVGRLQSALDISRVGTTYQVEISLMGAHPDRLAEIVNAVTNTYIEKAKDEEFYGRDERLETLRQERTRLQSELDARLQEQADIAKSLGVAIVGGGEGGNPFDSQLEKMRSDLNTAHGQRIQAEAQLSAIGNGDPSAPNSALSAAADEIIAGDPQLTALKTSLGQKRSELLGTLAGLTPNNPLRKQTEQQLSETEAELQKMQSSLRAKAAARLEEKLHAEVNRAATVESRLLHDLQQRPPPPPPPRRNSSVPTKSRQISNGCSCATTPLMIVSATLSLRAALLVPCTFSNRQGRRLGPSPARLANFCRRCFLYRFCWESPQQCSSICWIRISTRAAMSKRSWVSRLSAYSSMTVKSPSWFMTSAHCASPRASTTRLMLPE